MWRLALYSKTLVWENGPMLSLSISAVVLKFQWAPGSPGGLAKFTDTADGAGPETTFWRICICRVMNRFEDLLHNEKPFSLSRKPTHFFLLSTWVISIQIKRIFPEKRVKKSLPVLFICLLSSLWIIPVLLKSLSSLFFDDIMLSYFLPDSLNLFWLCSPMNPCFFPRDCFYSTKVFRSSNPFPWLQLDLYTNEFKTCISIQMSLLSFRLVKWIASQRSVFRYLQILSTCSKWVSDLQQSPPTPPNRL